MAWNSKAAYVPAVQKKVVPLGSPPALINRDNYGGGGDRGYKDGWDIERAYSEGMSKITWVWRAIDAIASNQAKLPMVMRSDNRRDGSLVSEHPLLNLLNNQSNMGEDSYSFRYRLSTQLNLSTRGVFIEVIRDGAGAPIALQLLPPQHTAPVPDPKSFVKYFEVKIGDKLIKLKPADVIWIRRAHPLDPYLSMTPLEPAGIATEIEQLAKIYNRNFLQNDGRPGGLLVLRSEVDDEDKLELQSRFRGNIARAGAVGVISSEDGADFVDTAASPRDANYQAMREITKEEILAAFGVPESIIGNSAARTFANAMEESKVFWMETMQPHLELIGRPLSMLSHDHVVEFDISGVPILVLAKQEQAKFSMTEFQNGLISVNEYRDLVGLKKVESELADSLLANPNLTPLANTEKPMDTTGGEAAGGGAPLGQEANQALQDQVTEFNPASGQFESLSEGAQSVELPASKVPSGSVDESTERTGESVVPGPL